MMSKKHSAVLAVILLFCFALCGCVGQVSGEASHSPSNGASVEPSPTVSEAPKPSIKQIGFEAQYFEWDLNCTGYEASSVIVNSRRELEEYYKNNKKDKDYQLELIEKLPYDDAFFADHSLILTGWVEPYCTYWYEVQSVLFTDEKHITVEINTFVPEANSPAEMGYSFYIATDQKLPSNTPIELKNTNLSVLFVSTKDYPTENTSESTLPPAVIGSKQELEEYISRYASRDAVFKEAAKEYDDDYFKENSLIFIQLEKGDPSTKPSVKRVLYIYDEKRLVIETEHIENEETRDEAVYNIFMTKFRGPLYGFGADTRIEVIESDNQT